MIKPILTKNLTSTLLGCLCLLSAQVSSAVSITPGTSSLLNGTTFATNPDLGGTIIRDVLRPFEIADSLGNIVITGNVQDRVVRSTNTGELIFAPRLRDLNNPNGDAWIYQLNMMGFEGFTTDVDYRTDGLGNVGPDSVSRNITGDILNFSYGSSIILPPDESYFLSVMSNATEFDLSGSILISASNDFGGNSFSTRLRQISAPSAVPLPASVWLFGSGLIGLLGISRRKRNQL